MVLFDVEVEIFGLGGGKGYGSLRRGRSKRLGGGWLLKSNRVLKKKKKKMKELGEINDFSFRCFDFEIEFFFFVFDKKICFFFFIRSYCG